MPNTANRICEQIGFPESDFNDILKLDTAKKWGYIKSGTKVRMGQPLFPKYE